MELDNNYDDYDGITIHEGWEPSLYDSEQDQVDQEYNGAPQVYEENK